MDYEILSYPMVNVTNSFLIILFFFFFNNPVLAWKIEGVAR
jgi:hypothetical protein